MTKYLISKGYNINENSGQYKTPLMLAMKMGHIDIVEYALKDRKWDIAPYEVLQNCAKGKQIKIIFYSYSKS